ncbi:hypothetical protein DPEC_G00152380 [Dallia pectoralis]|uniref:Uncharacterized protein n=1 Tax=Dallia pectoralis TaxID=75939 RepID=A0ACC2GJN4_DALPE|nr:hypothetical protein DPEC_G00152380 [Dallia pectoralis]
MDREELDTALFVKLDTMNLTDSQISPLSRPFRVTVISLWGLKEDKISGICCITATNCLSDSVRVVWFASSDPNLIDELSIPEFLLWPWDRGQRLSISRKPIQWTRGWAWDRVQAAGDLRGYRRATKPPTL